MTHARSWPWLFAWLMATSTWAAEVMPPAPTAYCNDYARVLSSGAIQEINRTLEEFEKKSSSQVVVALFPRMESPSSIEDYVQRIFVQWKIGQKGQNNGALLAVFVQDHRLRIHVGYGLEGTLPDARAKRIIEDEITPRFRRNDYDGGIRAGVTAILQSIRGEYKGTGRTVNQNRRSSGGLAWLPSLITALVVLSIVARAIRRVRGTIYRRGGRRLVRSGWMDWGGGWSRGGGNWGGGGGSWGGGGGGGFSGGGGDSGGGGASGSW